MKKDLKSVILKVSSFLGKEQLVKDEAKMEALVTHLSFDKMKDNKAVNKAEFVEVWKANGAICKKVAFWNALMHWIMNIRVGQIQEKNYRSLKWSKNVLTIPRPP